jgi:hypothetical protein
MARPRTDGYGRQVIPDLRRASPGTAPPATDARVCLQCGVPARRPTATSCGRCGLPLGEPPRAVGALASCPVCYRTTDEDGRLPSHAHPGRRLDLQAHIAEHDRHPVGDDEWLETLRHGDRIRIGHWDAPFDLVRRYLVTGVVDAGRSRAARHDTIVTAMSQIARWGTAGVPATGDTAEWQAARRAVSTLMERYHRHRL